MRSGELRSVLNSNNLIHAAELEEKEDEHKAILQEKENQCQAIIKENSRLKETLKLNDKKRITL